MSSGRGQNDWMIRGNVSLATANRAVLWLVIVLVPLSMAPRWSLDEFNTPKINLFMVGLGIALVLRAVSWWKGEHFQVPMALAVAAGTLTTGLLVSWLFSPYREWAFMGRYLRYQGLLPYVLFVLFALLVADVFRGREHSIATALMTAGAIAGLYSIIQAFRLDPILPVISGSRLQPAFSTIGNSNFAGGFQAIALPIAAGVALRASGRRRDLALASGFLILCGLIFSASEGAWLAGAGGICVLLGLSLPTQLKRVRIALLITAGAAGVFAITAVAATMASETAASLFGPTVVVRANGWETAFSAWRDRPAIGWGPNTLALLGFEYRSLDEALTAVDYADDPHSVPIAFLGSTGLVGALAYIGAISTVLTVVLRAAWSKRTPLLVGFSAGLSAYAIQSFVSVDDVTIRAAFWATAGGALALAAGSGGARGTQESALASSRKRNSILNLLATATLVCLGLAITWQGVRLSIADRAMYVGTERAKEDDVGATSDFRRAISFYDDIEYRFAAGVFTGELGVRKGAAGRELFEEMRRHFEAIGTLRDPTMLIAEARLLHVWAARVDPDVQEEALELFRAAHMADPGNTAPAVYLATALSDVGQARAAIETLSPYVRRDPPFPTFWGAWALVNAKGGTEAEARAAVELAQERAPSNSHTLLAEKLLAERFER